MARNIKITKGLDIKLKGDAEKVFVEIPPSETVVIKPTDFPGLRPKLAIKVGEEVTVRVREIDNRGRINLTLRGVPQNGEEAHPEPTPTPVAPLT